MRNVSKRSIIFFIIGALIVIPFSTPTLAADMAADDDLNAGRIAFDALVVRPLGLFGMAVGAALFIVSIPFSALGGNTEAVYKKLVTEPAEFTLKRPLGDF